MTVVGRWTGRHADALREALRMTNEAFAEHLRVSVRSVVYWRRRSDMVPQPAMQEILDAALNGASDQVKQQFHALINQPELHSTEAPASPGLPYSLGDERLVSDPALGDALHWLDEQAEWPDGEARSRVRKEYHSLDMAVLRDRAYRRASANRRQIAASLAHYYGSAVSPYEFYAPQCGEQIPTTIVTQPGWLDLRVQLGGPGDGLVAVLPPDDRKSAILDVGSAVRRLAETIAVDTRLVNAPLYRLLDVLVSPEGITGALGLTHFVNYALTLDLLENELVDAISDGAPIESGALPLRDRYLPNWQAITNVGSRLCAGGPLALFAVARPEDRRRNRAPDYVVLIQERSSRVLNANRRLAVIPKAFHQPLVDFAEDAQLCATLEREMEEELFGRPEMDSTYGEQRHADPMHIDSLSAPMRWLVDNPGAWRIECTAFGINSMTGNFEFPALIVIDDERWWGIFGGSIAANWETEGVRRYSSLNHDALVSLVHDPAWSDEGLFAFAQGLRRLSEVGGDRVNLPSIELEG